MKVRIELDGEPHMLELHGTDYVFDDAAGSASVEEVRPGVFSILLGSQSVTVSVAAKGDAFEVVSSDGVTHVITVSDTRDRAAASDANTAKGPVVLRAQMPGKIVKLLVEVGAQVEAGQGLIVVEAMKMQNEMKSPKGGVVTKILAGAGATVAAGETLVVVE